MDLKNENKLTMFVLMQNLLSNTPREVLDSMPGFENVFTLFNNSVDAIRSKNEIQSGRGLGFRLVKDNKKSDMVMSAVVVSNCIKAYAIINNDVVLAKNFSFTKSSLLYLRDTESADTCQFIHDKGVELLGALAAYGITEDTLVALKKFIDNYNDSIPKPRMNIVARKIANAEIDSLLTECMSNLSVMDSLVSILQVSNVDFHATYFNDRKIINHNGRRLSIRGYVYDVAGAPLEGAVIGIKDLKVSVKSAASGYYEFKNLPDGVQKVVFERPGFVNAEALITTMVGQRVDYNATLENVKVSSKVA